MAFNEDSSASGHDEPWIQWCVRGFVRCVALHCGRSRFYAYRRDDDACNICIEIAVGYPLFCMPYFFLLMSFPFLFLFNIILHYCYSYSYYLQVLWFKGT